MVSIRRFFQAPPPPEPYTANPALRSESLEEMLGLVGLRDQLHRIRKGVIFCLPCRAPGKDENKFKPYIQVDVGERDRLIQVSLNDWQNNLRLQVNIRHNPETRYYYIDHFALTKPAPGPHNALSRIFGSCTLHPVPCDHRDLTPGRLRHGLNMFRTAVARTRAGNLNDLQRTCADIEQEMADLIKPDKHYKL